MFTSAKVRRFSSIGFVRFCQNIAYFCSMEEIRREIIYDGRSLVRSTYEHLGTEMEDITQSGYERYHSHRDIQLMYLDEGQIEVTVAGLNVRHIEEHHPSSRWSAVAVQARRTACQNGGTSGVWKDCIFTLCKFRRIVRSQM